MKLFIITSKSFYDSIPEITKELESRGHVITLPNSYDEPFAEDAYRELGKEAHSKWKEEMYKRSEAIIEENDAVLVLNFKKNGVENYIGGATFMEMYDAFRLRKKIYLYNDIPEGILKDEIVGFAPVILNGNLDEVK
jgi:hypothetical protein